MDIMFSSLGFTGPMARGRTNLRARIPLVAPHSYFVQFLQMVVLCRIISVLKRNLENARHSREQSIFRRDFKIQGVVRKTS